MSCARRFSCDGVSFGAGGEWLAVGGGLGGSCRLVVEKSTGRIVWGCGCVAEVVGTDVRSKEGRTG